MGNRSTTLLTASCVGLALLACKNPLKQEQEPVTPVASATVAPSASGAPAGDATSPDAAPAGAVGPSKNMAMPFAVGQFVRYANPADKKDTFEYEIYDKEGEAFWFEVNSTTSRVTTSLHFLLRIRDDRDTKDWDLQKVEMKVPGLGKRTLTGGMLKAARKGVDAYLAQLTYRHFSGKQEDVTAGGKTFPKAYVHEVDQTILNHRLKAKVWNHSAVPILAMVKNVGTLDGKPTHYELVAYGTSGAKADW